MSQKFSPILFFPVICPGCNTKQIYKPRKGTKRPRKVCSSCHKKFTPTKEQMIDTKSENNESNTPSMASIGNNSTSVNEDKKVQIPKPILPEVIELISNLEGESTEKSYLLELLKEYESQNSTNDIFLKKDDKGVGGWGSRSKKVRKQEAFSADSESNEHHSKESEARNGPKKMDHHGLKNGPSQNKKVVRGDSSSNKDHSSRTRGMINGHLNSGHSKVHFQESKNHGSRENQDDNPGPGKGPTPSSEKGKNGIYVVHTPLEFLHIQFNDEVSRLHDHRRAKYENFSPRRFGITQDLADKLRPLMQAPHWKDPAEQYRKKIPGEFVFLLTKDNTCVLYPRHGFSDMEFFKWIQNHLKKRHMKNLAYYYARARSSQTNEMYIPRIGSLVDEDPANFLIKVELDNPNQRFFVRRDKSKGDEIEFSGPTRQGEDWAWRYLVPALEHSISIQSYNKLNDIRSRLLSQDAYLRNEIPKLNHQVSENNQVLVQLLNKQRSQRVETKELSEFFTKLLAQGDQQSDLFSDFLQGQENQTIELEKTLREILTVIQDFKPQEKQYTITDSMTDKSRFLKDRIEDILTKNQGLTRREIHENFSIKRGSVNGTIYRLIKAGKAIEKQGCLFLK